MILCGPQMDCGSLHTPSGENFKVYLLLEFIDCFSMADVTGGVAEDLSKFIPNVCTNSPVPGMETSCIIDRLSQRLRALS